MQITQKYTPWIYFAIILIVIVQFFWVHGKYETIESEKVFNWTFLIAVPIGLILGWFAKEKITNVLFYSYSKRISKDSISKSRHFKNVVASYALFVMVIGFLFYGIVIQTNDWFGTNEKFTFNTKIISAKKVQHARYRSIRRYGASNITYDIEVKYKGKIINLSTETEYQSGDYFNKTLNVGGLWKIIYEE